MADLEPMLYEWVAADLIKREQANAILTYTEHHAAEEPAPTHEPLKMIHAIMIASCLALVALAGLLIGDHLSSLAQLLIASTIAFAVIVVLIIGHRTIEGGLPERIVGMLRVEAIVALSLGFGTILSTR